MKKIYFDTVQEEAEYNKKRKNRKDKLIGALIFIPIAAVYLFIKFGDKLDILAEDLKDPQFYFFAGLILIIALIIYLIFRKREKNKNTLFKYSIVAAAGIVMIGMFIVMCLKALG